MSVINIASKNFTPTTPLVLTALMAVALALLTIKYQQQTPSRILTLIDEDEKLPPLFPFRWEDYLGFGVAVLGLLLAAGGGIGGGGILVPTYILLLDFPVKHAIPLASATFFGGAIANNLLNSRKIHPNHPSRSVIDWELILQLEPMTILGALVGAVLNDFLSDLVLVVMMVLLLAATAQKTLTKAHKLREQEDEERRGALDTTSESQQLIDGGDDPELPSYDAIDAGKAKERDTEEELKADSNWQGFWAAFKLTALFVVVTVLNLLKGGPGEAGGGPMGLEVCGAQCFWMTQFAIVATIALFAIYTRHNILKRKAAGRPVFSDIAWDARNTVTYPLMAMVAGLVAGLFGVGGGIIKGPLMLALGVHPAVASATSACMILFTSSTATVSYMIFGLLVYDYALFCVVLGFCSTVVGQTAMTILMERYKRNSYIAYSIGGVVAISAVAMAIESVIALT